MKYTKTQTQEALEQLQRNIQPGQTLRTIVTHVSRSGMSRSIRVLDGFNDISWLVARVLDERMDDNNGGLRVSGCGMDMGFDTVYRLGYALFPNGFTCTGKSEEYGKSCPASDHVNGDRDYTPHIHKSGGYALRQQWL